MSADKRIIIVGAGLCGSLLGLRLVQKGFEVDLYEKRSDLREEEAIGGRSINLALSARGLWSIDLAGIQSEVLSLCIPMRGRMIHPLGGASFLSPYSGRSEDYINSVSRGGLNALLLNEADKFENLRVHFDCKVHKVDLKNAAIKYTDQKGEVKEDQAAIVVGTDGAGSVVRRSMMAQTTKLLFNYSQDFLRHGYKELSILPAENNSWKIHKEALHIWPRGAYMIIALPNLDGSFTLTMFHPYEGHAGFSTLNSKEKLAAFFNENYADLLPFIPHYQDEYFENPVGTLGTIKCYPWQAYGKSLIMGDASHAIVPFYGQGMNASFEDVRIFMELLDQIGDDWEKLFKEFQDQRVNDADAIGDLAVDNFYEMRDKVDDVPFIRKRKIEMQLEQQFPDYYSKYSLVSFKQELPYAKAKEKGRAQDEKLLQMCERNDFDKISLEDFYKEMQQIKA